MTRQSVERLLSRTTCLEIHKENYKRITFYGDTNIKGSAWRYALPLMISYFFNVVIDETIGLFVIVILFPSADNNPSNVMVLPSFI